MKPDLNKWALETWRALNECEQTLVCLGAIPKRPARWGQALGFSQQEIGAALLAAAHEHDGRSADASKLHALPSRGFHSDPGLREGPI